MLIDKVLDSRFVRVADTLGKLAIFFAIATWIAEIDDRAAERENLRKEKLYKAFSILSDQTFLQVGGEIPSLALKEIVAEGVSLKGIQLTGGLYENIDLSGIDLADAWIDEAAFKNVDFSSATLTDVVLEDMIFDGSDFSGADFSGAILKLVDFSKSTGLTPSQFRGAAICSDVVFPTGFNLNEVDETGNRVARHYARYTNDYWKTILDECV
ncbi:MAG: pentapeptide repeat-containing protein [Pseudomonadota bacterium]